MLKAGSLKFVQLVILFLLAGPAAYAGSEVGEEATDFTVTRLDGTEFKLSDYRGDKMVNLVFWATWCPVCQAEIPALKAFHEAYGDDVELLALAINASSRPIPGYVEKHELTYPVAFDASRNITKNYNITGTPTQILIDKEGVIVYRDSKTPDFLMSAAAGSKTAAE